MLDYKLPYHIIEEEDGEYYPKVSFETFEEAEEFVKFAPKAKLKIVKTEDLRNYYLEQDQY